MDADWLVVGERVGEFDLGERSATALLWIGQHAHHGLRGDQVAGLASDRRAVEPARHAIGQPVEHAPGRGRVSR